MKKIVLLFLLVVTSYAQAWNWSSIPFIGSSLESAASTWNSFTFIEKAIPLWILSYFVTK